MKRLVFVLAILAVVVGVALAQVEINDGDGSTRPVGPGWVMPSAPVLQRGVILATSTTVTEFTVATFPNLCSSAVPFYLLEVVPASGMLHIGPPNTATAAMASISYVTATQPYRAWVATTTPTVGFTADPGTSLKVFINILK